MAYNVFISHSSVDQEQVKPICAYLEDKGITCFVSYRDIPSGVSYPGAITRAMRESDMLLLVLSADSNASTQVDRELTMANDQKKKMSCFRLADIPYSDDKAYLMSGVNWLNAFPNPEQHYFALLQDVCRQLGREVPTKEETVEERRQRNDRKLGCMLRCAAGGNSSAQYDLGTAYYDGTHGLPIDKEEAFRWLMKAARKGHVLAENSIGVMYASGEYVEANMTESIKWYRLAALHGNVVAQSNLGHRYLAGDGVERDLTQAIKWLRLAADQGYDNAQGALGDCYARGEGVEQDYAKAVEYYSLAAAQDNDEAQIDLAHCYQEGLGVEQSIEKCLELLEKAAANGSAAAMTELAGIYRKGNGVERDMERAFKYTKDAAERNDPFGVFLLALSYRDGDGCEADLQQWFDLLVRAARLGWRRAQTRLADIYSEGDEELGIEIDAAEAEKWYRRAIEQGDAPAMVNLGYCYSSGGILPLDDAEAARLFRKAAELDNAIGQNNLAEAYQQGEGVEQSDDEAFAWCSKSAEQGYPPAMARLGEYYFYGFGTEQDFAKAVEWLDRAAREGNPDARYLLGVCYEHGYGVEASAEDAMRLYSRAAKRNRLARITLNNFLDQHSEAAEKGNTESLYLMGIHAAYIKDEPSRGNAYFLRAAEAGYVNAYNNAAWTFHLLGRYEEALPWAEKAVEHEPDSPAAVDTLAHVLQGLGRTAEAEAAFERCRQLEAEAQ